MSESSQGPSLEPAAGVLVHLAAMIAVAVAVCLIVLLVMRVCGLHWSWAVPTVLAVGPVWIADRFAAIAVAFATGLVTVTGAKWHAEDLRAGGDIAAHARRRRTPVSALRSGRDRRRIRHGRVITESGLVVGRDHRGRAVHIPVGGGSGRHTLVLGATGSGKTVTQAWIAGRLITAGHAAVVVDPKGDRTLRDELHRAARRTRREFREWTPEGPDAYNPFAHGSDSELADKALAGETYTEPHYLRQAQRYLGHATRTLRAAGQPVTLASLTEVMSPRRLEAMGRRLDDEHQAQELHDYLDDLSPEQLRGLAGTRDRLAILAESDVAPWLQPHDAGGSGVDLLRSIQARDVVYFRLDADRRPLLAAMLAAAIVQDLLTVAAHQQHQPRPTLVLVDEFSAVSPDGIARLFGRGRSAGMSLLLGTQELADLHPPEHPNLADQLLGNLTTLIAHRQVVPDSAEQIAAIAGTRGAWVHTQRTDHRLNGQGVNGDTGTRTRGREFAIHPDEIKQLRTGWALVACPGRTQPRITRMLHPENAR
jgi:type IV secretory pathway TraG/TraD family ATPase VirD4